MCRSTSGSCSVTPSVWPAGRIVTLATGSACSDSAATRACPDSCTATACFSSGSSTLEPSRRPRMIRSLAASKSAAVITSRPSRTAKMAASLTRLARSAPEKPGVPRAMAFRSTSAGQLLAAAVHGQDRGPLADVRQRDRHLPVEPARPQQGRVEDLRPVRRREHHDARRRLEAVHLGEQLVERLLPLVVGHVRARAARAALADRVDLVDEDDGGRALARLGEQVTDPGRADADEQLDEAGPGHGEERHVRLARHRAGQQRLAGAGRPDHEHAAGHHRARPWCTGPASGGSPPPRRSRTWRPRSRPRRRTWCWAAPRRTPWPGTGPRP